MDNVIQTEKWDQIIDMLYHLPSEHQVMEEVSGVMETGNIHMCMQNMKYFIERGTVPEKGATSLPAVLFSLPYFQNYLVRALSDDTTIEDLDHISRAYLESYKSK